MILFIFSSYSLNLLARLVRVALVAVVCDKPAAHKMGGFGSHSHNTFCTRCKVQKKDLQNPESYDPEGVYYISTTRYIMSESILAFPRRTEQEHRWLGAKYAKIHSYTARKKFVNQYATRFTQLSRLPYFSVVRCVVVDPMHNLILGTHLLCPKSFLHIRFITSRSNQDPFLSYLGSMPDPPTKP